MTTGWGPDIGEFPYPPPNVQVLSPMFTGALDIRWDDPSILATGRTDPLVQATGTITVTGPGVPFTLVQATGTITGTAVVPAGEYFQIGTVILMAAAGPRTPGLNDFDGTLAPAAMAADIVDALNDAANDFQDLVVPSALGAVVTVTAVPLGSEGNALDLLSSTGSLVVSGATLEGGVDADLIVIGGVATLTAVAGVRVSGNNDFSVMGNTFAIAQSIADAINDPNNLFAGLVTASASYGQVTLTAVPEGARGNGICLETTSSLLVLSGCTLTGGCGIDNCRGQSNSKWQIVGVNVYRSDSGEKGPYFRLNSIPVGGLFFRDSTDNARVENEIVDWGMWLSKGDSSNNKKWTFRTRHFPIVKAAGQAIHANSSTDITITIDGIRIPAEAVFGPTGEVTLINVPTYDLSTEKLLPPVLPKTDGSSLVQVSYHYNRNVVRTDLENKAKIFYRLTSVAVDPSTPSGLTETPLGWSPPVNVHSVETFDYIWREAVRRNTWILQQGGERVKLFIRRMNGVACPCRRREQTGEYLNQPFDQGRVNPTCPSCYGTSWVSGYEGPYDVIIAPDDAERSVTQTPAGRHLDHTYEVWTSPSPMLSQRDFIVKQTGERYSIGPTRRVAVRGLPLQQHFSIAYLGESDIRYQVPIYGITELPWPQVRTTDPNSPCEPSEPFPVGFDRQATTMETEHGKIPDEREKRGRTPVWRNTMY